MVDSVATDKKRKPRKHVESTSRNKLKREDPERGRRVKDLRAQGLTVRQIALIVGVSKSVVGRFLRSDS